MTTLLLLSALTFSNPGFCPTQDGPKDCRGKEIGTVCETYGPHGGKVDGECRYVEGQDRCGCFYLPEIE